MRKFLPALGATTLALALSACGSTRTVQMSEQFTGPVPGRAVASKVVALDLDLVDSKGNRYPENSIAVQAYRKIATDALHKVGHTVVPSAPATVRVSLKGTTPEGLIDEESSLGRNMAMGVLSLGFACDEVVHTVGGSGRVTLVHDGAEAVLTDAPIRGEETSCFSKKSADWLANQQEVTLRLYERSVTDHIGTWLPQAVKF